MSAWIVSKLHVAAMIRFLLDQPAMRLHVLRHFDLNPEAGAGLLYAENVRSVNHRYQDSFPPDEPLTFTLKEIWAAPDLSPVAVLKACDCLEYQSCETSDYRETKAFKLLEAIRGAAISALPGYDEAQWGIDEPAVQP